jgi:uncharacterized protein DUF4199
MAKLGLEIKWGLIFAGMEVLWIFFERIAGFHDRYIGRQPIVTGLILLPAVAIYVFALLEARKARYRGAMTYKQGLVTGLILTMIIAFLSPLTQTINTFLVSPNYFENAIRFSVEKGVMGLDAAKRQFSYESYLIQGFIGAMVTGAVISAVLAAFIKRKTAARA